MFFNFKDMDLIFVHGKAENPYFSIPISFSAPHIRGALYLGMKVGNFHEKMNFSEKCQRGRFGALFAF